MSTIVVVIAEAVRRAMREMSRHPLSADLDETTKLLLLELGFERVCALVLERYMLVLRHGRGVALPRKVVRIGKTKNGKARKVEVSQWIDSILGFAVLEAYEDKLNAMSQQPLWAYGAKTPEKNHGYLCDRVGRGKKRSLVFRPNPHLGVLARLRRDHPYVVALDIRSFFDSVGQDLLEAKLKELVEDAADLQVIMTLAAAGMKSGVQQGVGICPLLADASMTDFDNEVHRLGLPILRYADDIAVCGLAAADVEDAANWVQKRLEVMGHTLHPRGRVLGPEEGLLFTGYLISPNQVRMPRDKHDQLKHDLELAVAGDQEARGRSLSSLSPLQHAHQRTKVQRAIKALRDKTWDSLNTEEVVNVLRPH